MAGGPDVLSEAASSQTETKHEGKVVANFWLLREGWEAPPGSQKMAAHFTAPLCVERTASR